MDMFNFLTETKEDTKHAFLYDVLRQEYVIFEVSRGIWGKQ